MKDIARDLFPATSDVAAVLRDPRRPRTVPAPSRREGHAVERRPRRGARSAIRPGGSSPPRSPPMVRRRRRVTPGRTRDRHRTTQGRRPRQPRGDCVSRSRQQVVRMLALVPYLQGNDGIPVNEVAAEFGVTPKVIRDDLRLLMYTGTGEYAGELIDFDLTALEEDGVVHIRDAEFMTRPLRISAREGVALIVALRTLRASASGSELTVIDSALAKLESAVGDTVAPPVDVLLDEVDPTIHSIDRARAGQRQAAAADLRAPRHATSSPTARSTRGDCSPSRASSTSRPGASGPQDLRFFRLDRVIDARGHRDRRRGPRRPGAARPVRRHLHRRRRRPRTPWSTCIRGRTG